MALRSPAQVLCKAGRRFSRHDGGVVATEFALIVPFLLLVLLGVMELTNALMVQRKLLNATQTTADLIGQQTNVTSSDLSTIYLGAAFALSPYDTSKFSLGVASVRFDDTTGDPVLDWTDSYNGGSVFDPLGKATGRGKAGDSIIIVSGVYNYSPLVRLIIPVNLSLSEVTFMRPRTVSWVMKY